MNINNKYSTMLSLIVLLSISIISTMDQKVVKTMTDIITEIQKANKVGLVGNEQISSLVDQINEQKKEFIAKDNKYMEERIPTN